MSQGSFILRCTALLSVGILAVHDLRYRLACGDHADHALEAHGHGHLPSTRWARSPRRARSASPATWSPAAITRARTRM